MASYKLIPQVNEVAEFREIAFDFGNPLDILRESISNAFDATATEIRMWFSMADMKGRRVLRIIIDDNGTGMNKEGLQSFFDLGNSLRYIEKEKARKGEKWEGPIPIGEKGHGTKVYFNSAQIVVHTSRDGKKFKAEMEDPYGALASGRVPDVQVEETDAPKEERGTQIIIYGYNDNQSEMFNHARLKDHIFWFTKFGSWEQQLGATANKDVRLFLQGLDVDKPEELVFGHPFPKESPSIQALFDTHDEQAPDFFCKRFIRQGTLPGLPQYRYDAVFYVEGNKIKQQHNPMIKRVGKYQAPAGGYTVTDRYGIWLCKDFIPVARRNEPIGSKGTEHLKLHAFFNCQDLRLSANRGSIEPTPSNIKNAIDLELQAIYDKIMTDDDMDMMDWFQAEAEARKTVEKERKDLEKRTKRAEKAGVAMHKGVTLVEPQSEVGVLALVVQLSVIEPDLFPFTILDYDSHSGYDVLVKGNNDTPIQNSKKFYVEYKHVLGEMFNHSFQNLRCIVCWSTRLQHDSELADIGRNKRKMQISTAKGAGDHTKYFLVDPAGPNNIEVYVLKLFLKEKLGVEFKARDETSLR